MENEPKDHTELELKRQKQAEIEEELRRAEILSAELGKYINKWVKTFRHEVVASADTLNEVLAIDVEFDGVWQVPEPGRHFFFSSQEAA